MLYISQRKRTTDGWEFLMSSQARTKFKVQKLLVPSVQRAGPASQYEMKQSENLKTKALPLFNEGWQLVVCC